MGPGGMMGPPPGMNDNNDGLPKPKSIKEVPGYLVKLIGGFLSRMLYIFRLVWETGPWIMLVMTFMAVFNGVMPVVGAYISANLLNSLANAYIAAKGGQPNMLVIVISALVLQFAFIFINNLVSTINHVVSRIYGELVVNHIKVKIMNKAKEIDLASFDRPEFYEKLENASREAGSRPIQIMNATFSVVSTLISMVSFVVILWAINPAAPFIIVVMAIPSAIINFTFRRKNFQYIRRRSKDRRQMTYYSGLLTNKDMVKEIRMFDLSDLFIERYKETFKRYFAGLRKLFTREGMWNIGITVVTCVVNCLLFLYIAERVAAGELQVGDYSLYTGALNSIMHGVTGLISTTATIYEGTLFIDNMIAFMKEEKTVVSVLDEPVSPARHIGHTVVFENVSFRYPGTERDVIRNVDLTLNAGDTAVLVGLNGAGKTTLIKLLTRLYDPTEGRIMLDGRDIREYDTKELYKIYGIIFQDFGKYAVDVTENIAFGQLDKQPDAETIALAAEQSNASEFIEKLPDRYDTPLMRIFEDNGIELSTGQWQKLAVARAFYSDSDILILDEPTASLDPLAEQEIYNQFDELRKEKTTIFVSHRLSSATTASKIIVLEQGRVVELGDHKTLMALHGRYHELFTTQAKRYLSANEDGELDGAGINDGNNDLSENSRRSDRGTHGRPGFGGQMPPEGVRRRPDHENELN